MPLHAITLRSTESRYLRNGEDFANCTADPHFVEETNWDAVSIGSRVTGGLEES